MAWIDTWACRIASWNRARKLEQFLALVQPGTEETVVDVGVDDQETAERVNYLEKHYAYPENITAVSRKSLAHFSTRYHGIKAVIADGCALPFPDDHFDIAYSNAVIEHVGKRDKQLQFLRQLYRVAGRGYLTTPNRYFPVEVHSRVPLLHILLPKSWFDALLWRIGKPWAAGDYMCLLSRAELESLIHAAGIREYQILRNRFFGVTLTLTAVWRKPTREVVPRHVVEIRSRPS